MFPSADVRESDILKVDIGSLQSGEMVVNHWKTVPVFTVRRTDAMLMEMQKSSAQTALVRALSRSHRRRMQFLHAPSGNSLKLQGRYFVGIRPFLRDRRGPGKAAGGVCCHSRRGL